jgi:hypothetical protein
MPIRTSEVWVTGGACSATSGPRVWTVRLTADFENAARFPNEPK